MKRTVLLLVVALAAAHIANHRIESFIGGSFCCDAVDQPWASVVAMSVR
jgi:hypothetical protein